MGGWSVETLLDEVFRIKLDLLIQLNSKAEIHFVSLPLPSPPTLSKTIEDSGIPVSRAATANQNVTINILREKPEEWLPCLPRKLQHSNGAEDDWLAESEKENFYKSNGTRSLTVRVISCNRMRQITIV